MIHIVSDYPDKFNEEKPLGDPHGLFFWHLLYEVGINVRDMEITYLWDDYKTYAYDYESYSLKKFKGNNNVIIPLGRSVCRAFGITDSLDKIRGSVVNWNGSWVIPTFHPRDLKSPYRTFSEEPVLKGYFCGKDLEKAKRVADTGWQPVRENFNIQPDITEWREFVKSSLAGNVLLGCDIEATGLSLEYAKLVVIGFAVSESECMVYPFTDYGGEAYWPEHQRVEADQLLRSLLSNGRLMFQNGVGYDVPLLRHRGYEVPLDKYEHDTMIMHHALDPELPHNIGFINSIYGKMQYWKEGFLTRKEHIHYTDQDEMRIYNARDCINLHQIMPPMMNELTQRNLMGIYNRGMAVARPVIEMQETGLEFSQSKYRSWTKYLEEEMYDALEDLRLLRELPEAFNLNSGEHKRWLFYRQPIKRAEKAAKELAEYNLRSHNYQYECPECKRKRSKRFREDEDAPRNLRLDCNKCGSSRIFQRTKQQRTNIKQKSKSSNKYIELQAVGDVMSVEPFIKIRGYTPLKTKTGELALDGAEMERMLQYITRRLEAINLVQRKSENHVQEEKDLLILRKFNVAYQRYAKLEKLQSSFGKFPVWKDGRVRPSILVTGTSTGRFSCKNPNLQQIPSGKIGNKVRACFTVPIGYTLLSVDFSNLEVHIGARIIKDRILIKELEEGNNYHDINTKALFNIDKSSPLWAERRAVAKMFGFARLMYGGSDEGIYGKILVQSPDFDMSLSDFKLAVQSYMDSHPDYVDWVKRTQERALAGRITVNAGGRTRTLYGSKNAILRQALNTPIQGSAADEVSADIIILSESLKEYQSKLILQIHDELLFYIKDEELKEVYPIIVEVMNRERTINGFNFRIPIDSEIGTHWGELYEFNPVTFEKVGDSKH